MSLFSFKKNNSSGITDEIVKGSAIQLERLVSGAGKVHFADGKAIDLRPEDVSQIVAAGGRIIEIAGDIAKINAEASARRSLIYNQIDKMREETKNILQLNQQKHEQDMEKIQEKQKNLYFCLQWLDNNPSRSAQDLIEICKVVLGNETAN